MKKILYIGGFELPDKNAAAQRVLANAKLLRELGFEVFFKGISKDIGNAPSLVDGFYSNPVKYPTRVTQWVYHIFKFMNLNDIINIKPDYVILYNFPAVASLQILIFCHSHGIKVVHDLTEWECNKGKSLYDIVRKIDIYLRMHYCVKKMDGVIAISRFLYEFYKDCTDTILVPPTVDLLDQKFQRERTLTGSDKITKLVYAGSAGISAVKDRLDIIIKEVNKFPNIQLDVIGQTKEQFEKIYGKGSIVNNNIIFHGCVSHSKAVQFVCDADFQMLIRENSLKNRAGFPTKFVESFSCCTPVIATDSSNICDYLEDGINGMLVTDKNPLFKVLDRISKMTKEEKIKMKEACKGVQSFDYRRYKGEFLKIFI